MKSVQLFVTCLIDMVRPEAAISAVHVLERRGIAVDFPEDQTCCGQFSYNAGYAHEAALLARHFIEVFENKKKEPSQDIVALSGSCAAMIQHTYPELLYRDALEHGDSPDIAQQWKERAITLGERTHELSLWLHANVPSEESSEVKVKTAYHMGCHMRRLLAHSEDAMSSLRDYGIEGVEPKDGDQCCGFGGTYSFTEPLISTALADAKLDAVQQLLQDQKNEIICLTSADLGCLLHLEGRLRRTSSSFPVCHVAELIDLADQNRLTVDTIKMLYGGKEQ
ncbi:(Fe-S)-binding protein [Sulfobacillus thermosulfidooxidans]|uniref:(Fe-S)-binding protein n=1 Tax=Sulfobacillus thermosulfidooxidans TaxID=28034 RepID=UPI000B291151|nr:(Fe-S)-binding protein [Sulfobacillus thermosulfidooxidans]